MQKESHSKWVCPSDRHLSLRAKLDCGWSVRTATTECLSSFNDVTENELMQIKEVILRSQAIENNEQLRIGAMVHQLELIQSRCSGNGVSSCILCGEQFGRFIGSLPVICMDCKKKACSKCSVEFTRSFNENSQLYQSPNISWLCKICSESRKLWKMSGAWFFRSLPKFILPKKTDHVSQKINHHSLVITSTYNGPSDSSSVYSGYNQRKSICIGRARSSSSDSSDIEE